MMAQNLEQAAELLRKAYAGETIPPLRDYLEPTDIENAYTIQAINTAHWSGGGRKIVGRKIGLTAKVVQQQLGVDQPDFGILYDDMRIPNDGTLPVDRVIQPKAEAEIALILGQDLPPRAVTNDELAECVAHAVPAIEIVDSRIADWKISFADTVADNGSSGMFVLGSQGLTLDGLDLWSCGMVLQLNGEIQSLGAGAACLGHPLNAATWLANLLADRDESIRKGDILLTGALGPMVTLTPGDAVRATIGGLGTVSFRYGA